jgi:hypothetical protein
VGNPRGGFEKGSRRIAAAYGGFDGGGEWRWLERDLLERDPSGTPSVGNRRLRVGNPHGGFEKGSRRIAAAYGGFDGGEERWRWLERHRLETDGCAWETRTAGLKRVAVELPPLTADSMAVGNDGGGWNAIRRERDRWGNAIGWKPTAARGKLARRV